jgi:Leucine-rich repeat (LRR) protein
MSIRTSDIEPLRGMRSLQWLDIDNTPVSDLSPLAEAHMLETLDLRRTKIVDLSPISSLTRLKRLILADTELLEIAPLRNLEALEHLDLSRTSVHDLSALAGVMRLSTLVISETPISDLSPLATIVSLATAAKRFRYSQGLIFGGCPNLSDELKRISSKANPSRTVETLNYLRIRDGLPPISDDHSGDQDADWRAMAQRLVARFNQFEGI